jgi:hypothetical protein
MAELVDDVTAPRPVEDVFTDNAAAAVELIPGADVADIMLLRHGEVFSLGATSELSVKLDQLQQHLGEGPCAKAAADTALVRTDDFAGDGRWPRYSPAAVELGVRSCLSFKLYSAGDVAATMNIFGFRACVWDDDSETIGAVLAAQVAGAINPASGAPVSTRHCVRGTHRAGQGRPHGEVRPRRGLRVRAHAPDVERNRRPGHRIRTTPSTLALPAPLTNPVVGSHPR